MCNYGIALDSSYIHLSSIYHNYYSFTIIVVYQNLRYKTVILIYFMHLMHFLYMFLYMFLYIYLSDSEWRFSGKISAFWERQKNQLKIYNFTGVFYGNEIPFHICKNQFHFTQLKSNLTNVKIIFTEVKFNFAQVKNNFTIIKFNFTPYPLNTNQIYDAEN